MITQVSVTTKTILLSHQL